MKLEGGMKEYKIKTNVCKIKVKRINNSEKIILKEGKENARGYKELIFKKHINRASDV